MKRLLLIILCLALLGSLFIPAFGEVSNARRMYVRVPASWETVYLWSNGEAGEIFGPQPGVVMAHEDDHYILAIPNQMTEFTLSGRNGETTGSISTTPDHDLYVTVNADGTVQTNCIGFENPAPRLRTTQREYCLVGYINNRDYGFENDYLNIGEYIFVNGSLTTTFNSDSYVFVKTTDNQHWYLTKEYCTDTTGIFVEEAPEKMFVPGNVEVTFTLTENNDNTISLSYTTASENVTTPTKPTVDATPPEDVPSRMLTIIPPTTWNNVSIYAWSPTEYGPFPGRAVEKDGDQYQIRIKNTTKYLVLSGDTADGRHQTGDIILVDNGKNATVKIMVDDAYVITYADEIEPRRKAVATSDTAPLSSYRVTGNAEWLGLWNPNNPNGIMSVVTDGLYRITFDNVQPGTYEYKITKNGSWDGSYGPGDSNWSFTVDASTKLSFDLQFIDQQPVPKVYGEGVVPKTNSIQTEENPPASSLPDPSTPDPIEPDVTTAPTPEQDIKDPDVTDSIGTDPNVATLPTEAPPPSSEKPSDQNKGPKSFLSNLPFGDMKLFLFGVILACVYTVYLLVKKNSVSGNVTAEGKVLRRKRLSKIDVENAVKENMPASSQKLDQSVMEAIAKAKEPPVES